MNETKAEKKKVTELKIKGILTEDNVKIPKDQTINELSGKGYGVVGKETLILEFYEALYLLDKGFLEVMDEKNEKIDFLKLLQCFQKTDKNGWSKYLTYRDLRGRGYVVREGFGLNVDFRVYGRGNYGRAAAKYLILSMQEGAPITLEDLTRLMIHCQNLKKALLLAVMNRRGEIVYYSISQLTLK